MRYGLDTESINPSTAHNFEHNTVDTESSRKTTNIKENRAMNPRQIISPRRIFDLVCVSAALTLSTARAADYTIKAGSTDQTIYIQHQDVEGAAPSAAYYVRPRSIPQSFLSTQLSSVDAVHSDGKYHLVVSTDDGTLWRLDLPDAAVASGAANVSIFVEFSSGTRADRITIDLLGYDPTVANLPANVTQINADSTAATNLDDAFDESGGSGVDMALASLKMDNPSGTALTVWSNGGNGNGIDVQGNGTGAGLVMQGGATGEGGVIAGLAGGLRIQGLAGNTHGLQLIGIGSGDGFRAVGGTTGGDGMELDGDDTGDDLRLTGSDAPTALFGLFDGALTRAKFAADSGLQTIRSGTAQTDAGQTSTSIKLDASASGTPDFYKHDYIYLTGFTGAGQYAICTGYNATSKVATIAPAWRTNPDGTTTFAVLPAGIANVEAWLGTPAATPTQPGVPEVDITHLLGSPVCD
jgi:hypothetical protein